MSSVYARGSKLWFRVKQGDGAWASIPSGFAVGQEREANAALREAEAKVAHEVRLGVNADGKVTVASFFTAWIERRKLTVRTWKHDETRVRLHVLPALGGKALAEVQPRHLSDLFRDLRLRGQDEDDDERPIAPKTIHNTYAAVRAMFRDAQIEGLIAQTPCILTEHQLGAKRDADPEWRNGAQFTRDEAEALISDARIPFERRMLWALMVAGGLRVGEAVGLRWRHLDREAKPLGSMFICTSYDTGTTKTGDTRKVPIHPTLAALLAQWRGYGWAAVMGHAPGQAEGHAHARAAAR
jgi:integrase